MIPGGGLKLFLGFLPHLSSTPRGGLGTFWRRICTAPSAFRPPRLLCGRAASYGSIIVWKYQEAAYSPFKVLKLFSFGEKFLTLTSHREGSFRNIKIKVFQKISNSFDFHTNTLVRHPKYFRNFSDRVPLMCI